MFSVFFLAWLAPLSGAYGDENSRGRQESLSIAAVVDQPSIETDQVDIILRGLHLRLPRNYVVSAFFLFNKLGLALGMNFPDFQGATTETIRCFHGKYWLQCANAIEISAPTIEGLPQIPNWSIEAERVLPDHDMQFGLARSKANPNVFFHFGDSWQDDLRIGCSPITEACDAISMIGGKLVFTYRFHQSHLNDWKMIHENVTRVMNSFLVGEAK